MTTITRGNVFEALGFDREESVELALRTQLMLELRTFIEANGLTQARAAEFFGTTQPRISYIVNGRIETMSSEYLISLLARTGGTLTVSFRQPSRREAARRLAR